MENQSWRRPGEHGADEPAWNEQSLDPRRGLSRDRLRKEGFRQIFRIDPGQIDVDALFVAPKISWNWKQF